MSLFTLTFFGGMPLGALLAGFMAVDGRRAGHGADQRQHGSAGLDADLVAAAVCPQVALTGQPARGLTKATAPDRIRCTR